MFAVAVQALVQQRGHRLRRRQVAGTEDDDLALVRDLELHHLAKARDMVDAGIGAGVGSE